MQRKALRILCGAFFFSLDLSVAYSALPNRNNIGRDVLMTDRPKSEQAGATRRCIKNKSEETMPTLPKIISRACFGLAATSVVLMAAQPTRAQTANTSFFITSVGIGNGANLGGLAGADNHCQTLAQAAGAGGKTWHAYLSTQGASAVNARDRIGKGPWTNAKGAVVAKDVAELHGTNNLTKQTA